MKDNPQKGLSESIQTPGRRKKKGRLLNNWEYGMGGVGLFKKFTRDRRFPTRGFSTGGPKKKKKKKKKKKRIYWKFPKESYRKRREKKARGFVRCLLEGVPLKI